jgi:hypothetical protein
MYTDNEMRTVLLHILVLWVVKCLKDCCCNPGNQNVNLHCFENLRSCIKTELLSKLVLEVPCDVCYVLPYIVGCCTEMSRGWRLAEHLD